MSTLNERFWSKVKKGSDNECWLWQGALTKNGYGNFSNGEGNVYAHRYSYFLYHGCYPQVTLHQCDNRRCVNPAHLISGTLQDNINDMVNKGRSCFGTKNGMVRWTEQDIKDIRRLCNDGMSQSKVAHLYETTQPVISNIILKKRWKHL